MSNFLDIGDKALKASLFAGYVGKKLAKDLEDEEEIARLKLSCKAIVKEIEKFIHQNKEKLPKPRYFDAKSKAKYFDAKITRVDEIRELKVLEKEINSFLNNIKR